MQWLLNLIKSILGFKTPAVVAPTGWTVLHSKNMPNTFTKSFDFPNQDGVHYVVKQSGPISIGKTVSIDFTIEGDGELVATQGTDPARLRLFLQQAGDTLTAEEEDKRWWSVDFVNIGPGNFTRSVLVSPEAWSQVYGKNGVERKAGFKAALADLANIGFTFGGTFAGHGVYAKTGNLQFKLNKFSVE